MALFMLRSNSKPEIILVLFIILSNIAIIINWYAGLQEKVTFLTKDEKEIPVNQGAVYGHLDNMIVRDSSYVEFYGWAFDGRNSRLPDAILLWYDGENIYWGQNNKQRPDLVKTFGDTALKGGFKFVIPLTLFKDTELNTSKVRLFAVSNGVASELNYPKGFK